MKTRAPSPWLHASIRIAAAAAMLASAPDAGAQSFAERLYLRGELGADLLIDAPQAENFDPGAHGIVRLGANAVGPLGVQLGAGSWWFPANQGDVGRLITVSGGVSLFFPVPSGTNGGPFLDFNIGPGLTGDLQRLAFDTGLGWDFEVTPAVSLGPALRYAQIVQPNSEPLPSDARIIGVSLAGTFRIPPPPPQADAPGPPPDTDGDGIADDRDRCFKEPEDADGILDEDGCPEDDADSDGIADARDDCPEAAEVRNGFEDDDGCPDEAPKVALPEGVTKCESGCVPGEKLTEPVLFAYRSHRIRVEAEAAIANACDYLKSNTNVRVRVNGHADEQGTPGFNHELSARRAGNVARWLVKCGIEPTRIDVAAYGESLPACGDETEDCYQQNRRAEFEILPGSAPNQ